MVPTWLKITLVVVGLGMLGMCAIAGAGVYFVSQHVNTSTVSAPDALRQFEDARAKLKDQRPLIDIDTNERVTHLRPVADIPTAPSPATTLVVMAWDPTDERIVNFRIPLWVLAMGERKVDLGVGAESFDMRRLNLDVKDLQRIGPALVLDLKSPSGDRALVWTE
ncbi:MAG: hypothetical protein FJW21_00280 [Acidimicrobiia bacterium]|nr:hypothetical protein [Acidimicrobiia bacterium]